MIWADRVGVVWGGIVLAFLIAINEPAHTNNTIVFWIIAAPWLLMRALDWVCCGEFRHVSRFR